MAKEGGASWGEGASAARDLFFLFVFVFFCGDLDLFFLLIDGPVGVELA